VGTVEKDIQVKLDTRITDDLAKEGMAREVIRRIQDLRKTANLEMEDRIVLYLGTPSAKLQPAIDAHRDYIASETLTEEWSNASLDGKAQKETTKIEGQELTINLRKLR
jgi:isoleucyl-tRNA synthetase